MPRRFGTKAQKLIVIRKRKPKPASKSLSNRTGIPQGALTHLRVSTKASARFAKSSRKQVGKSASLSGYKVFLLPGESPKDALRRLAKVAKRDHPKDTSDLRRLQRQKRRLKSDFWALLRERQGK